MKKLKYILIIIIIFSLFIKTKAISNMDYDISLENNETIISFIIEDNINALYIRNKNDKTLIILNYNNEKIIEKDLKIYDINKINNLYNIKPVVLNIYGMDSKYLKTNNNLITLSLNNNNFCIYNYEYQIDKYNNNCKFIYVINYNPNITENNLTNSQVIFQNYNRLLPTIIQEDIYDKWIDLYTINKEEYALLKIYDDNYQMLIIPRNSDNF